MVPRCFVESGQFFRESMMSKKSAALKFKINKSVLYVWVKEKTKKALQEEAALRDMSMTKLVSEVLENAVAHLRPPR